MKKHLITFVAIFAICAGVVLADVFSDGGWIWLSRANIDVVDDTSEASTLDTTVQYKSNIPLFAMYQLILRCVDYCADYDTVPTWVCVDSRVGDNGSWATACSTRFTIADSSGKEIKFSYSMLVAADTTSADGWYFGDQFRVRYKMYDSTAQGTAIETTWGKFEVILKGRKY